MTGPAQLDALFQNFENFEVHSDWAGVRILKNGRVVWRAAIVASFRYEVHAGGGPVVTLATRARQHLASQYIAALWRKHKPKVFAPDAGPTGGDVRRAWLAHWHEWRREMT